MTKQSSIKIYSSRIQVILFTFFAHLGTLRLVSPALHTFTTNADRNTATIMITRLKQ